MTIGGYCREAGINENSFYSWRNRLAAGSGEDDKGFIEVRETKPEPGHHNLRVRTPEGYVLEIPPGADAASIRAVITALGFR
jgi:hypothetical protein